MPTVLYLVYLTVQEEMLTTVGLTAENGIAPAEVWLFCFVVDITAFFSNDSKQTCLESRLRDNSQGLRALCYSVWHTFLVNDVLDFSELC